MRISIPYILVGMAACCNPLAAAETLVVPQPSVGPTLTVEQPQNPVSSKPGGPILLSISARLGPQVGNAVNQTIIPVFHFVAPNGNAVLLHRELVDTNGNNVRTNPVAVVNIPADAQKLGATVSGGWTCSQGQYYATMVAYVMDDTGIRSNSVRYTFHCNGG